MYAITHYRGVGILARVQSAHDPPIGHVRSKQCSEAELRVSPYTTELPRRNLHLQRHSAPLRASQRARTFLLTDSIGLFY